MAAEAAAPALAAAASPSFLALEPRLQREVQQKVQRVRNNRAAKVSGALRRGGGGPARPGLTRSLPAGGADAGRGVRGAPPAGALRAADPRVLPAVRDGDAAPALQE